MYKLPTEVKLHILEYGGESNIGVRDEEIVSRIKEYDPFFDYNRWKQLLGVKKEFVFSLNLSLIPLHSLIKENTFFLKKKRDQLRISGLRDRMNNHKEEILSILKEAGYPVTGITKKRIDGQIEELILDVENIDTLMKDILHVWICQYEEAHRDISYRYCIHQVENSKYPYLSNVIDSLSIPGTLPLYLQDSIKRKREEQGIKEMKMYPLYLLLESYKWTLREDIDPYNGITYALFPGEADMNQVEQELYRVIGSGITRDMIEFHISDPIIHELIEIDTFYHPHIIPDRYLEGDM